VDPPFADLSSFVPFLEILEKDARSCEDETMLLKASLTAARRESKPSGRYHKFKSAEIRILMAQKLSASISVTVEGKNHQFEL
jgi:hypothetical protein